LSYKKNSAEILLYQPDWRGAWYLYWGRLFHLVAWP